MVRNYPITNSAANLIVHIAFWYRLLKKSLDRDVEDSAMPVYKCSHAERRSFSDGGKNMTKNWMLIAAAMLTIGCTDGTKSTGGDEADADTDADADFDASVAWNAGSVDLTQTNGVAGYFGMAETTCAGECWFGEDCIYGDLTKTYFYCHPTNADGVSLLYGGAFASLSEGTDTVFGGSSFDGSVTYYAEQGSSCYVWGHDTSYYSGLGCTEL
ncbi:MAG: hypothetical protein ACI8RZ_001051 [Myxococcota bacterium]|jgi:hypothetical protein